MEDVGGGRSGEKWIGCRVGASVRSRGYVGGGEV